VWGKQSSDIPGSVEEDTEDAGFQTWALGPFRSTSGQDAPVHVTQSSTRGQLERTSTKGQLELRLQRFSVHEQSQKEKAQNWETKNKLEQMELEVDQDDNVFNRVVHGWWFDSTCAAILVTNSVFIGLQVEYKANNPGEKVPPAGHMAGDAIYAFLFLAELGTRMFSRGLRVFFLGDDRNWNIFDFFVVTIGTLETIIMLATSGGTTDAMENLMVLRTVRIIRVVRVVRVFRLMRFFRSLRILVSAILNTGKNCLWAALLLFMILFIFGILFAQAAIDKINEWDDISEDEKRQNPIWIYWGTLPRGIYTCFKSILGGIDWEIAADALSDVGSMYVCCFIFMIIFTYLAVLNVISGIFIQSSIEEAQQDLDHIITQELNEKNRFLDRFEDVFGEMDVNGNQVVNLDEFEHALRKPKMQNLLHAMGVEANDAWTLFKLLDADGGGTVDQQEFLEGCLSLKGPAKSIHIAQQRYESKWLIDAVLKLSMYCEDSFNMVLDEIAAAKESPTEPAEVTERKNREHEMTLRA
jgi:hypothetical protein